jgi:glutathione S-transferase
VTIERCQQRLDKNLGVLDDILSKQKYMAGDTFTVADINYMAGVHMLFMAGEGSLFTDKGNVMRWWNDISGRTAWKKCSAATDEAYTKAMEMLGIKKPE